MQTHRAPGDLTDPAAARAAVERWATEEQFDDPDAFCQTYMGSSFSDVIARLQAGQEVSTSFDVIAYLFPGGGGGGRATSSERVTVQETARAATTAIEAPTPPAAVQMDPRLPGRVLVSVMCADGQLRPGERHFIDAFLTHHQLPAVVDSDLRTWRPAELGPRPSAEVGLCLLEAAVHLMHLDRERDGSEYKVIRAFATAWGVSILQL